MTFRLARPIPWDIYEEHLNEAAWLWGNWEQALDSAVYALGDVVVGPEERLLAHLDGLVLGGQPVAQKLLLPALVGEDLGGIAAAAWALVQAEDADHQDVVIGALSSAEPPAQTAIGRALHLAARADVSRLVPLFNTGAPLVRAIVLDVLGTREPGWVREHIDPAMRSGQPPLVAAALRAVRNLHEPELLGYVELVSKSDDIEVRLESMRAGLAFAVKTAWNECRTFAGGLGEPCRLSLGLLATSPDPSDRAFVRGRVQDADVGMHALWALGFAGDADSADVLVQAMADEKKSRVAGEAFAAITGLSIAGEMAKLGKTQGPDAEEVADEDSPPAVRPEDFLPEPQVEKVKKWWDKERRRFVPGTRYVGGQPRSPATLRTAFLTAGSWRREVLLIELAASVANLPRVSPLKVDLKGWAREQIKQLEPAPVPVPGGTKVATMARGRS
jgi:uncharacterized protein (TIGR02270 family)